MFKLDLLDPGEKKEKWDQIWENHKKPQSNFNLDPKPHVILGKRK
jgi:hypothetical protein